MCINQRTGIRNWSLLQFHHSRAKDAGDQRRLCGGLWTLESPPLPRGKLPTRPREGTLGLGSVPEPKMTLHLHLPLHLRPLNQQHSSPLVPKRLPSPSPLYLETPSTRLTHGHRSVFKYEKLRPHETAKTMFPTPSCSEPRSPPGTLP